MDKTPLEIFDELQQKLANPEGTEARLVSDLLKDHISNSENDHGEVPKEALDHFDLMLEELLVVTMNVRRAFNGLRGHSGDHCPIPFSLRSAWGDISVLKGRVEITPTGVEVGFDGHGTCEVDSGAPVFIEQQNGVPRILCWSDINTPDITHLVGLGFANEKFRRDDNGIPTPK